MSRAEHTSLAERFGALQLVRAAIVGLALGTAAVAPSELGITVWRALPLSLSYLGLCVAAFFADRARDRSGAARGRARHGGPPAQQVLLPIDSAYLAMLTVPSGGAQSELVWLFTLQLIAVTLLASWRTGLRLAMWDSVLLIGITLLKLGGPLGELLGAPLAYTPSTGTVLVRISGFWAVTVCTAYFSSLSERELRRSKAQLDALTKMASRTEKAIESGCTADQVAAILLPSVLEAFAFTRVAVTWVREGGVLTARVSLGDGPGSDGYLVQVAQLAERRLESPAGKRALLEAEPVLLRKLDAGPEPLLSEVLPGASNVVIVPMRAGSDRQGLLLAESGLPAGRRMGRRSLDMLTRFAAHAALALSNADLREEVANLAASDPLTGLPNRRALTSTLSKEIARTARTKRPLSLAVMDIDYFKQINDTYGHLTGDEVLRQVAGAMAASVRVEDLVARYGGEEFAIVLPDCAAEGALAVVERVRVAVASAGTLPKVTISAGIATVSGEGGDAERLLAAADEALYISKNAGRDRATVAPSSAVVAGPDLDLQGIAAAEPVVLGR